MILKILGACLVLVGCGGFGFYLSYSYRNQVKTLRQYIAALEYMECDLAYRQTPLPEMFRRVSGICTGQLRTAFWVLAKELEEQIAPDAASCVSAALKKVKDVPGLTYDGLVLLGRGLGCFDAEGQLRALRSVRNECERNLQVYTNNQDAQLRTYQTLGICAGAAMAILFI